MNSQNLTHSTWTIEQHNSSTTFETSIYEAIAQGVKCATVRRDKKALETFKGIQKKVSASGVIFNKFTASEQSFIRIWYMRSLEQ